MKKTLIVGGTGFAGGYTALHFQKQGHDVTLMSRSPPKGTSKLNDLPFVQCNYIEDDYTDGRLEGYDNLVFCSGSDGSNFPRDGSVTEEEFYEKANIIGIPRFFEAARAAGITRTVYMGSFYSFVSPESIDRLPYVRSRHISDAAVRSMDSPGFHVCSVALPWVVGHFPGYSVWQWHQTTNYALGRLPDIPVFAPPGGANFITCQAVAEAMLGGLERGEGGKAYVIGDENLSWKAFFELWFKAAGRPQDLEVRDDIDHFIIPREILAYLHEGTCNYEEPAEEIAQLGYKRGGLRETIEDTCRYYASWPE